MTTYLIQILFGATLLLVVASVVNALLYKAAASLRHRVWTCTLCGLLALPVLSPMLPTNHLAGIPGNESRERNEVERPDVVDEPQIQVGNRPPGDCVGDSRLEAYTSDSSAEYRTLPPGSRQPTVRSLRLPPALPAFMTIWLLGTIILLAHLFLSIRSVRKLLASLEPTTDSVLDELCREFGIKRSVRLVIQVGTRPPGECVGDSRLELECGVPHVAARRSATYHSVPFISGIFRPTIVLPPQAQHWTVPEKRAVLTHELAHVVRGDLFWQLLTQIVCAVYWFHPLVWFAAYRIWIERESACDDTVVLRGEKPSVYADLLLELANTLREQRIGLLGCTVAMTRKNNVGQRILAILNPNLRRLPLGRTGTAVFLCVAVLAIVLTATLSPFAQTQSAKEPGTASPVGDTVAGSRENVLTPLTFRGKVLNPDGTPADTTRIYLQAVMVVENQMPLDQKIKPTYSTRSSFRGIASRQGEFDLSSNLLIAMNTKNSTEENRNIPTGANVLIYAYSFLPPMQLVSEPLIFLAEKDQEDMTIQLQKGIRVEGTVKHDDGTPINYQIVSAFCPLTPPVGAEHINARNDFCMWFWAEVKADGKYELYLPPGDFQIKVDGYFDESRYVPISVKDREKTYRADLTLPAPLRGKVVKEDGSVPEKLQVVYASKFSGGTSVSSPVMDDKLLVDKGTFALERRNGSFLAARTGDGLLGMIHPIPDDKLDEFQVVVLKPTATVKVRLCDASDKPLVGQRMNVSMGARIERSSSMSFLFSSTTNAEGVAVVRLPPGTADYQFTWGDGERLDFTRTLQSGETVDLGTVKTQSPQREQGKREPGTTSPEVNAVDPESLWNLTLEETIKIAAKNGKVQTAEVEQAYWNLWAAYYRLESARSGRDAALEMWQKTKADSDAGSPEGQADLLAQAEQNYLYFRRQTEVSQDNLFRAESALRDVMRQTDSDRRLIRPTDNPSNSILDKFVWENLGIQYAPMPKDEFEKKYQKFVDKYQGGITVTKIREQSPAEQARLQAEDVLVGIASRAMESASDIRWIGAQEWTKLQAKHKSIKADVIRNNSLYVAEIPMQSPQKEPGTEPAQSPD